MVVAFTVTEINYFVINLFFDVVLPLSCLIFVVLISFGCTICLISGVVTKSGYGFHKNHSPYFSRGTSGRVIFKQMFSLNSVSQNVMVMALC